MNDNHEVELKLRVVDSDCGKVMKDSGLAALMIPGSRRVEIFEAVYYDTEDGALRRYGLVFRVRREGERWVSTVKAEGSSEGGLSKRLEWNIPVESNEPDISIYQDTDITERLQGALAGDKLLPLFVTRFERESILLALSDSTQVELAADRGDIIAGNRTEQIAEIELELKEGNIHQLLKLGTRLAECYHLIPEPRSKFERGLKLAGIVTDLV